MAEYFKLSKDVIITVCGDSAEVNDWLIQYQESEKEA